MASLDLTQLRRQAGQAFSGFTSGQKAMLGLAGLATIIGAYFFLQMSSTTAYAPLYSNLQASDASAVTQQLTSEGVSYKLSDGGATIMVPQDKVYQLRLDMSAKGLPTDGAPGYSLLDKAGITTSEFQQSVDYQRALEGELSKTINAIQGVSGSTVHLVIPKQDVFASDNQHPSASVLVKLPPGKALASGQVQSILHLVASSVEGLSPDQVTVADDQGRMLAAPGVDGTAAAVTDARTAQTASYQDQVAHSIEDLLAPVTGAGKAKVTVAAQLDFNKSQTTTEKFDQGANAPLVSSSSSSESYSGNGASTGGALATSTPTPVAAGSTGNGSYTKTDDQKQYAPSKVTEVVDAAPGAVQRMSVAVIVDKSANVDTQKVRDLVTAAAGIDPTRGDTVEVQQLAFDTTAADAAKAQLDQAKSSSSDQLANLLRTGGAIVIVAVVLLLAWRSAKKNTTARYPMAIALDPAALEPPSRSLSAAPSGGASTEPTALGAPAGLPSPAEEERQQVQEQIVDLIDRQPGDVAQVLRGWLGDRR